MTLRSAFHQLTVIKAGWLTIFAKGIASTRRTRASMAAS